MLHTGERSAGRIHSPVTGKLKPCGVGAHQLFEARNQLCQGRQGERAFSRHKPQALPAGPWGWFLARGGRGDFLLWEMQPARAAWCIHPSANLFLPRLHPDLLDMSQMVLRIEGPQRLPRGYEIVLHIPASDADKVGVFYAQSKSFLTSSSSFVVLLRSLQLSSLTLSSPRSSDSTSEATHVLSIPSPIFSGVNYSLFLISWNFRITKQMHRASRKVTYSRSSSHVS